MLNPEITQTRTPTQEINPVFVNRWSPRGMTGEELDEDDINRGGSFMQKEIPKAGTNFLACWLRVIRCGLKTQPLSLSLYLTRKTISYSSA
jgi:hypothetical protein